MADTDRIKSNLEKMIGQGAPEADIDLYLSSEGFKSAEDWRKAIGVKEPSVPRQVLDATVDFADRTAGYARTLGNDMLGGVIGLPRMVVEGVDWLGKKDVEHGGTGARVPQSVKDALPTPEEATRSLNLPPPPMTFGLPIRKEAMAEWEKTKDTPRPRLSSGSKIVDAAASGVVSLPFTGGGASWPAIGASIGGPVLSEVAGQATEGTPYETPARLVGAVVGAGGGAAIPSVVRKVTDAGKSVVAPFTAAGRDRIVGKTLFDLADDPKAAIARGEAYSPPVPGFNLPAPQAMRDDALMATQNALNAPGSRYGQRVNSNSVRLSQELDQLGAGLDPKAFVAELAKQDAGAAARAQAALDALPPGVDAATAGQAIRDALKVRHDALDTARSTAVNPLYSEARAFPEDLVIGPVFRRIDDAIANSKGDIKEAMQKARKLLFNDKGQPDWSASGMMNTRASVDDLLKKAERGSNEERLLLGIKGEIDNALASVPAEQQARQTFAQMSRPLDPFSADQGAKGVAAVLDEAPYTKGPLMAAEKVPAQFFRTGDAGGATMKEFLAANGGNQGAIDAMKSFVADKARASGDVKAFLQKHQPAIEALDPQLARQLEDAAATASISTGYRAGPVGKFLDGDLDAAVRSTLNAPDATKRMQTLRMSVGGNPEAVKGLQRAILDDFRASVQMPVRESAQDVPALSADKASKWLTANRGAVANALSPDQVKGLEAITRALKDQAQTAVKTAGSDTARNLATMSILDAVLWKGAGDAAWLAPVRKTLNLAYGGANEKALERLTEVLLEPKVAAALMKKASPSNVKLAAPVLESIARGTAIGAAETVEAGR
jgi:hypothetical protein